MVRLTSRERLATATHEVCHGAYASAAGLTIEWLTLSPQPQTAICWGVTLAGLPLCWRLDHTMALYHVVTIAGCLLAPYAITHEPLAGSDDQCQLHTWQHAWERLGPVRAQERPLPWKRIVELAWNDVERWSTAPEARTALTSLSDRLARAGYLSGRAWLTLWHSTQARPLWSGITGEVSPTISRARIPSRRR